MYNKFAEFFNVDNVVKTESINIDSSIDLPVAAIEFFKRFEGQTFGGGLYRVHKFDEIAKWDAIVTEGYPTFKGRIHCFAYDWLGRQFAIDKKDLKNKKPLVLMLVPGTANILELACDFEEFHEYEIPEYHMECLASLFYQAWREEVDDRDIERNKCIGYKVPLFLGGVDDLPNLELSDMEVYWGLYTQLMGIAR